MICPDNNMTAKDELMPFRGTGTAVTCFRQVSKGSQISIESFAIFLIPLVEFKALIRFVYLAGEVFFELGDYRFNIVRIFTYGILKCIENL